jgi:hypothetical protein
MSKRTPANIDKTPLTGVDHLFGRDLRTGGWFVEEGLAARGRGRPSLRSDERPSENAPDPAVIWALRNRRRG